MSQIADIITRLQMMTQEGSKSDRKLAALVLSDLDFASKAAISEIASRAEVSEPTVTRFCRNLGCEGVRDFKFWLAQAIAIGGLYLMPAPVSRDVREQRIANAITAGATQAIERMAAGLDMATLMSVAETLSVSKQILCIGSGGTSSMMATEMQNRLFRLGLSVVSQVDGQLQRMYAAVVSSETTVIGFSISGYAKSVVDSIALARQYGAKTVAITGAGSALAKAAEVVIPFQHLEDSNIYKPTSARYALLAIVDMIATATAESRDSKVLESLRRIKQSLNILKVDDPRLPLGD
ncbi:MAG: MurR/RpiR family transcriptional regulator [Rhizobiaceae bacterium]|nr:MurR/RpiR family transcriptional regulator [Rhizobiaceae bacterium]